MSRFKKIILLLLFIVVLMGIAIIVFIQQTDEDQTSDGGRSIDDLVENSHKTSDITTDLEDGTFVRIQFQIIADSKQATKEVEKREFQFKNILIKELSVMSQSDFKEGLSDLEAGVKNKLNEEMTDGTITDVYTISKILQ